MNTPLCVDLDGTLIKTDSLWESVILLLRKNIFYFFLIIFWLFYGVAYLKSKVAEKGFSDPSILPYSKDLLNFLKKEYDSGRKLILVTAADKKIATAIADYLNIFSDVFASEHGKNLKGKRKKSLLCKVLGEGKYDYAGNARSDLKVWSSARSAIIVNATRALERKVKKITRIEHVFPSEKSKFFAFIKAIRIHQYVKNFLIFFPLVASQKYFYLSSVTNSFIAFLSFCLLASSVYLTNDLLDLEVDRKHHSKKRRPFAAGDFPILWGVLTIFMFLSVSLSLSSILGRDFLSILIIYFLLSTTYSLFLKKKVLVDIFLLSVLYTTRIVAGVAAIQGVYSEWLMAFSIFFFLSLACVKRYSELLILKKERKSASLGRGYQVEDLNQLSLFGTISGYISTLVFAFYISSSQVIVLYHHAQFLWLVCLLLLYWISRLWLLTTRGLVDEDPVLFALKDRTSFFSVLAIMVVIFFAVF